jgi:2-hydroxy-6-oxonona-2,4-dienedioate hydrolase
MPGRPQTAAARDAESALWREHGLTVAERFIDIDDPRLRIRMIECGDPAGHPIVFVQGGLGEAWGFASVMERLTDFRCISLDRPGTGLSDGVDFTRVDVRKLARKVLGAVLDAADLRRADFVANSMGGWWTLQFALAHPSRVSKAVLIGCPALLLDMSAPLPMRLISVPLVGDVMVRFMRPASPEKARGLANFLGHPPDVGRRWSQNHVQTLYRFGNLPDFLPAWHSLLRCFLRPGGANRALSITADELRRLDHPALFLWGAHDPFGSVDEGRTAAALMPDARLEVVGVGHLPWWDDPDTCAARVRQFLTGESH